MLFIHINDYVDSKYLFNRTQILYSIKILLRNDIYLDIIKNQNIEYLENATTSTLVSRFKNNVT